MIDLFKYNFTALFAYCMILKKKILENTHWKRNGLTLYDIVFHILNNFKIL